MNKRTMKMLNEEAGGGGGAGIRHMISLPAFFEIALNQHAGLIEDIHIQKKSEKKDIKEEEEEDMQEEEEEKKYVMLLPS